MGKSITLMSLQYTTLKIFNAFLYYPSLLFSFTISINKNILLRTEDLITSLSLAQNYGFTEVPIK